MIQQCSLHEARGRWVLLATLLASSTVFLLGTVVIVALPAIQSYFNTTVSSLQWVINANLLTLSSLILIGGSLGDRFGRKRVFIIGVSLFTMGAVLSGLAWTSGWLITFQALQGLGSALMVPQNLAIINACFAERERGQAIGLWAGLSGGVAAVGPWLGGWLIEALSWRVVFFIVVPISLIAICIAAIFIPENKELKARKLDWRGTILILLGLAGITYGFIDVPISGWESSPVLISLVGGAIAIALFLWFELRLAEPLVPRRLFKNPLVIGANLVTFLLYFALNGILLFTVLNLQQAQGYSPAVAGAALLPPIILITFLAGPAGALADKIGPRWQMVVGPVLVALGIESLAAAGTNAGYLRYFFPGFVLFGLGMSLVIAPLTKSALTVEPEFSGIASGVNNAVARIAALMAVAILGVAVLTAFSSHLNDTLSASGLSEPEQTQILNQADKLGGIDVPETFNPTSRLAAENAIEESFVYGFRRAVRICSLLAFASAVIAFLIIRNPRRQSN